MLNQEQIVSDIIEAASGKNIWVAYSGGVDSHVLLHLLATAKIKSYASIYAIHIDHGLNSQSHQWTQHCSTVAAELSVEFISVKVSVENIESLGMEAAARTARYQALEDNLAKNDFLLTAQHQHDQAETVLLQLLRGAGPKGLSAMAKTFQLGETKVYRPLLSLSQADIVTYAKQHNLQWIDDPSNVETRWNRNYIRHTLWPEIALRWPSAEKTLSRSAEHCAEASELMAELAEQDLMTLDCDKKSDSLSISSLLKLSVSRQRNLLRHIFMWKNISLPSTVNLQRILDEVCLAKQDSMPMVSWSKIEIRRYQDTLFIMSPLPEHDETQVVECQGGGDVAINKSSILSWKVSDSQGVKKQVLTDGVIIRFRQGGEHIQLQGQQHHKSLKHLFQEWGIPPWQRGRIPLVFVGDELVAVVGYCISSTVAVDKGEVGYLPSLNIVK